MVKLSKLEDMIERIFGLKRRAVARVVLANLQRAGREVQAELAALFAQYERDGVLSAGELSKYSRLSSMLKSVEAQVGPKLAANRGAVQDFLAGSYQDLYLRHTWAVEQAVGVKLNFAMVSPSIARAASNRDIAALLHRNDAATISAIKDAVTQGVIQGKGYKKMAREIAGVFGPDGGPFYRSMRIARTEGHRVQVLAQTDAYNQAEADGVILRRVWSATLDSRTREDHGHLDGVAADENGQWDLAGEMVDGPGLSSDAAQSVACRCRLRAEAEGMAPTVRRVRIEGAKPGGTQSEIVPYQTYDQWLAARNQGA